MHQEITNPAERVDTGDFAAQQVGNKIMLIQLGQVVKTLTVTNKSLSSEEIVQLVNNYNLISKRLSERAGRKKEK